MFQNEQKISQRFEVNFTLKNEANNPNEFFGVKGAKRLGGKKLDLQIVLVYQNIDHFQSSVHSQISSRSA